MMDYQDQANRRFANLPLAIKDESEKDQELMWAAVVMALMVIEGEITSGRTEHIIAELGEIAKRELDVIREAKS